MRHDILSLDEVREAIRVGTEATFLDRAPVIDTSVRGRDGASPSHAAIPVGAGA
jgi:hypothetical protein